MASRTWEPVWVLDLNTQTLTPFEDYLQGRIDSVKARALGKVTLHEEMAQILREMGPLTAPEILEYVLERGNYKTRNKEPVKLRQIHARVSIYGDMFYKQKGRIHLYRTLH